MGKNLARARSWLGQEAGGIKMLAGSECWRDQNGGGSRKLAGQEAGGAKKLAVPGIFRGGRSAMWGASKLAGDHAG
jgi:hypothetical protein